MTEPVSLDNIDNKGYEEAYLADAIRFKMKRDNKRFWAGDNISEYLDEDGYDKEILINEAAEAFELVLDRLLIPHARITSTAESNNIVKCRRPTF